MTEIKNETKLATETPDPSLKLQTAKTVVKFIASNGAKAVTTALIVSNLPAPESKKQQFQFAAGTVVVSMMVGRKAKEFADHDFDETVEAAQSLYKWIKSGFKDETDPVTDTVTDPK